MIDTILIIKIQEEWVKEIRQEILPRPLSGEGKTSTRILKETVIYFGRILLVVESHQTPRGPSLSTRDHRATEVLDCFSHNRLSTSNAVPQHIGRLCNGGCEIPAHAQGAHIWNQWRPVKEALTRLSLKRFQPRMNRLMRNCGKDETSRLLRRRIQEEEEEIIRVPAFDNSDLIEKFKLTLEEWVKEIRQEILPRPLSGEGKTSTRILKEMVIYFGRILLVVESHRTPRGPSLSTRDHRAIEVITGVGNQDHHQNIELNSDQFQTLEVAGTG
ncbi:hypothetical protein F2Q68_00038313 [Brassica cretica]|uniref:Uncharacterized protein n=1 Tax=Brassica cretica TaxID=69181 RepID=A0A8S9MSR4_BRACR|nr:hypothetical protein F2Q68_00038313 [Brassica cretica]